MDKLYYTVQVLLGVVTYGAFGGYETGAASLGQAMLNAVIPIMIMVLLAQVHKRYKKRSRFRKSDNFVLGK